MFYIYNLSVSKIWALVGIGAAQAQTDTVG